MVIASLTLNIYFYLHLFLHLTRKTKHNQTPHLKPPKNQNRRAALGQPAIKLLGASTSLRSTNDIALSFVLVPQTLSSLVCVEIIEIQIKTKINKHEDSQK